MQNTPQPISHPHLMTDIHSHILFGVDDGARNLQMSLDMLKKAYDEGIRNVVCSSHSWSDLSDYEENFQILKQAAKNEQIDIHLHQGCEITCYTWNIKQIISDLNKDVLRTINRSPYALIEFNPDESKEDILYCARKLTASDHKFIIAHIERCRDLQQDLATITELEKLGFLFQANVYSLAEELSEQTREWARTLLHQQKIHFLGSDCHRINHRPPKVKKGLEYLYQNCPAEYANAICLTNPAALLNMK